MDNVTLKVSSLWPCDEVLSSAYADPDNWDYIPIDPIMSNPVWKQTATGCRILQLLQDMYHFNVLYISQDVEANMTAIEGGNVSFGVDFETEINVRPMNCRVELLEMYCPLQLIYTWRLGFILRRPDYASFYRTFYSKPFTRPAWNCLYGLALLFALIFYFLKRWERRNIGGAPQSFSYEALVVFGSYCQHIPPIDPVFLSRRTAYFIFFIFAYVIYTYYTSNLLSHIVNDTEFSWDLTALSQSEYKCVIVDYLKQAFDISYASHNQNYIMAEKINKMVPVTVPEGMAEVKAGEAAILSDYTSLYPFIKRAFNNDEICKLATVDLFSNMKRYIFTSKDFIYKEEIKIGILRAKEAGILRRLIIDSIDVPRCFENTNVQAGFIQISTPLFTFFCATVLSLLLLLIEREYHKRYRVWPYIE